MSGKNNSKETPVNIEMVSGDISLKALLTAAYNGHVEEVNALLAAKGADVNAKNEHGNTALILAAKKGNVEMVNDLLKKGAYVDAQNKDGHTALIVAAIYGNVEVVNDLLKKGADVNAKNKHGNTALIVAAIYGHVEVVNALLAAKGADVDAQNEHGNTALILAAIYGRVEVVNELLKKGADVDAQNEHGNTALILADKNISKQAYYAIWEHKIEKLTNKLNNDNGVEAHIGNIDKYNQDGNNTQLQEFNATNCKIEHRNIAMVTTQKIALHLLFTFLIPCFFMSSSYRDMLDKFFKTNAEPESDKILKDNPSHEQDNAPRNSR